MMSDKKVHFTGIGGAGMAPLAGLLLERGIKVSGSDLEFNAKCQELSSLGAKIFTGHRAENVPDGISVLVYTSAADENNPELLRAAESAVPAMRRGEFLAEFAKFYRRPAAVSGTHGKSSISALLSKVLQKCGCTPGYMIGAAVAGMESYSNGSGDDIFVTEADESDGTHKLLRCFLGIVPNIEDDHAWSVGGKEVLENNFRTFGANCSKLVYFASETCDRIFADHPDALRLENIPAEFAGLYGFQAANAFLVWHAAQLLGVSSDAALTAVADYPEVKRRMSIHHQSGNLTVIEDYAHHPTEVKSTLQLLRWRYPDSHLRVFFQPHRYARLERYFDEFGQVLREADESFIAPVFAAWSESGRVGSAELAELCGGENCPGSWQESAEKLLQDLPEKCVIAILGAGDIEKVIPEIIKRLHS